MGGRMAVEMTVKQAGRRLRVSSRTVRTWIKLGYFPGAYKRGLARNSHYCIPEGDIEAFEAKIKGIKRGADASSDSQ